MMASEKLMIGRVFEVNSYDLLVHLPNGSRGKVGIINICNEYKTILERIANENSEETVATLPELFHPGQLVRCAALPSKSTSQLLGLTLNPAVVNSALGPHHLRSGAVTLQAAVASEEDHGYTLDLGVPGVHCFLPRASAEDFARIRLGRDAADLRLHVGQMVEVRSLKAEAERDPELVGDVRVYRFTADPRLVGEHVTLESAKLAADSVQPGQLLRASVRQAKKEKVPGGGVKLGFQDLAIVVPREHLGKEAGQYKSKEPVTVRVLSVDPMSREILGSLLPHWMPDRQGWLDFTRVKPGHTFPRALVLRSDKRSAHLRVLADPEEQEERPLRVLVRKSQFADKGDEESAIPEVGAERSCRVLDFDLVKNVVIGSLKESILSLQFLNLADVTPGDMLRCVVVGQVKAGTLVRPSASRSRRNVQGLIPRMHVADSVLAKPEEHLTAGQEIRCRALEVDPAKMRLILTAKPSLVKSRLPRLISLEQIQSGALPLGTIVHGYVVQVTSTGLLVAFYNYIKGFIRREELGLADSDVLEKVFRVGQTVRCRLVFFDPQTRSLRLSLRLDTALPIGHAFRAQLQALDIRVGRCFSAVVTKRRPTGLDVALRSKDSDTDITTAFLPVAHLADAPGLAQALFASVQEGQTLAGQVAVFARGSASLVVTAKPGLIRAAQEGRLVVPMEEVVVGKMVMGVIAEKNKEYGLFVEMADNLRGLAPVKYITDKPIRVSVTEVLLPGQTVEAKVVEVCPEKKRLLLSLRPKDCYFSPVHVAAQVTATADMTSALRRISYPEASGLADLSEGSVVKVRVQSVPEEGQGVIQGVAETDAGGPAPKCVALTSNAIDVDAKKGSRVKGIVLYRDFPTGEAEVCLSKSVVQAVSNRTENRYTVVKEGQEMKAEVLLVREEFVLVHLRGHATGKLAYMPSRRQWNDGAHRRQFHVGQTHSVVVKRVTEDGAIVVNLKSLEPLGRYRPTTAAQANSVTDTQSSPSLGMAYKPGSGVSVKILDVFDFQLNVETVPDRRQGRIFITELQTDLLPRDQSGYHPLHSVFKKGQILDNVRIVGHRLLRKKDGKLTAMEGRSPLTRNLLEFSMRDKDAPITEGETIPVFFFYKKGKRLFFHASRDELAYCRYLNLADNAESLSRILETEHRRGTLFWATVQKSADHVSKEHKGRKRKYNDLESAKIDKGSERKMAEVSLILDLKVTIGLKCCASIIASGGLNAILALPGSGRSRGQLHVLAAMVPGAPLPSNAKEIFTERLSRGSVVNVQLMNQSEEGIYQCRLIGAVSDWKQEAEHEFGFVRGQSVGKPGLLLSMPSNDSRPSNASMLKGRNNKQKKDVRNLKVGQLVLVTPMDERKRRVRLRHWETIDEEESEEEEEPDEEEMAALDQDRIAEINIVTKRAQGDRAAYIEDVKNLKDDLIPEWEDERRDEKGERKRRRQQLREESSEEAPAKKKK